jgi:ABC-type nitrate/sulfonate/bicarbonate transport system substrate-binding protein
MAGIASESVHWVEGVVGNDQIRALDRGEGDYALLTQPEVELLVAERRGHIVLSLVEHIGPLHFSTVVASRHFLDVHPKRARGIVRGVQRAKLWMAKQPITALTELTGLLAPQLDEDLLRRIIRRARADAYWVGAAAMPRWHYEWLKKAYSTESRMHQPVAFADGVYNQFADELDRSELPERDDQSRE